MENKTKVVFSTVIGRVSVDADLTFSVSKTFLDGINESIRDNITACVSIDKEHANIHTDGHKKYNINLALAVGDDIRFLYKQNEYYSSKENNGRHHVDLNTLEIREIWIDGRYLRIEWYFKDCYGIGRCFSGNAYPIVEVYNDNNHENFYCSSAIKLQVYF